MQPLISRLLLFFLAGYGIYIIVELIFSRKFVKFIIEAVVLLVIFLVLRITTGFPTPRVSFGSVTPHVAIILMFLFSILGMLDNYLKFCAKRTNKLPACKRRFRHLKQRFQLKRANTIQHRSPRSRCLSF